MRARRATRVTGPPPPRGWQLGDAKFAGYGPCANCGLDRPLFSLHQTFREFEEHDDCAHCEGHDVVWQSVKSLCIRCYDAAESVVDLT